MPSRASCSARWANWATWSSPAPPYFSGTGTPQRDRRQRLAYGAALLNLRVQIRALGVHTTVRLYPNTGPRVRDHIQSRIVEELLRIAHPRWRRLTEVPVYRPARGRVDAVLYDPVDAVVVACEVHSQIRRLEQAHAIGQREALGRR